MIILYQTGSHDRALVNSFRVFDTLEQAVEWAKTHAMNIFSTCFHEQQTDGSFIKLKKNRYTKPGSYNWIDT